MYNWCTINKGTSAIKKVEQGVQIEELISIYEEALKLQHKGKLEEAKEKYEQLIDHKFLKKEAKARKNTKEDDKDDNSSPLLTLFFVVSKNYASVLEEEYNRNQDIDSAREALKYYLQAIEMDPTAYSIWYHVGCLSHSLKNLRFARLAYENGIFTNEETRKKSVLDVIRSGRFTPIQWNCFEGLCKVLCDIGDYFTCQHYIENTLKEQSEWTLGKTLLERMKEDPMTDLMDVDEQATSIEPVEITIEKSDLSMLMEKLLALYRKQHTANNLEDEIAEESLESNIEINNTMFINNAVKISIEKDEVPVVEAVQEEPHPQPSSEVLLPSSNIMPFTMIDHQISTEGETLAQDESEKSQKRKREDVVDAVTGEDEESDQEDTKKANLRASRRKKEKFLNTEASRMKMLQEEKQFDLKIQEFYDSLNTIPNLYKNRPWHEPQQTSIIVPPHFWDWFDIKINELESTYSWDMDGKRSDLDSLEHNSKGKGLTMFAMNYSINSTNDQSSSNLTKKIISNLNADNSGVVDVLCKLVITTVKEDMYLDKETSFMSNNLLELLTDTINSLEANFINHLAYLNTHEKALATLRICEYFIDRLIRAIMIATQEAGSHIGFSASYKKKASNMLSKQSKVKQIESLMETAKLWTNLAERHLFDISSTLFESNKNNPETSATLSQDEQKFQLRYYNILGKLAQCQDDIQNASRYYEKCKSILELNPSLKEINIKSMYDSFIDLKSMYNKLSLLRIGNLLVQAKDKSDVGDFPTVIEVIKPIVESKLNTGDPIESDETIQMIVLLAKAYTRAEQHTEAWNCYKQIFCSLVKQMVEYGSSQFQSKSILCKDEDVIFSKIGKHLGDVMDDLLTLIEDPESEKWLPKEADKNFIDILTIVLRMTVYYIFRHPDFVPLVNNFSSPDSIPHTPSRITKANRFNAIVIKSWIIHSHLIKRELRAQTRKTQKIMFDWVKLLQEFHDELGEREICCTSNDVFLHHLLNNLIEIDSEAFRKDIYQCYHCIYGVHLGAEADMIEEHYCTHVKMDQKAAERLFKLVVKAAVVKLQSGALLKGDLKDVIDAVSDLFEQLPEKQIIVDSNKKVIEDYMNSDLNLSSSINSIYRKTLIPILPVDRKKNNISFVYYKIFWIRGKTLRLQIRNRTKTSNEKNMTDLETAIEEFTSHLILNPDDGNAWYDLGVCYHQLADEELNWSASNIKSHKKDIADYQKKAFHAILRAIYLGGLSKDVSQRNEMFTQIGNLLYSMATPPMDMLAFEPETVNNYMDAGGNLISVKNGIPDSKPIYKLAVAMYIHALRYKSLQKSQWRCYYATGKCFAKIGRPPTEVLGWYMHAIQDSRQDRGQKELLIEPVYILCSSLAKYLFQGKISATLVMEYLAKEKSLQIGENSTEENVNDHPKQHAGDEDLIQNGTEHLPADVALAYKGIFKRLLEIISIDIKGWHHRPIYRIAWMQYYIFRNPERAKAELMKLFTLKPTVKSHISIWKPNYELPGKHYVYIHKYTSFLIKLVKETRDENTLEQLSRKLRKVQTLLLNYEQIMNELTVSEQTEQNKQVQ